MLLAERGLGFLFEPQMPSGQRGAQAKRTRGQEHVLHGRVDRGARRTFRFFRAVLDTPDQPSATSEPTRHCCAFISDL